MEDIGLGCVWVPLAGSGLPVAEDLDGIAEQLEKVAGLVRAGGRVFVHCSAGVRIGMFTYALKPRWSSPAG